MKPKRAVESMNRRISHAEAHPIDAGSRTSHPEASLVPDGVTRFGGELSALSLRRGWNSGVQVSK
jgi:hypothetical protein